MNDMQAVGALAVLLGAVNVTITVLFVVVAWRGMRAHERLAHAVEEMAARSRP